MIQQILVTLSEDDSKTLIQLLQEAKQLLAHTKPITLTQETRPEMPLKRDEVLKEFNLKPSTFYNFQRSGIITPHRLQGSRLTYYYRSEILAAFKKYNIIKHAR